MLGMVVAAGVGLALGYTLVAAIALVVTMGVTSAMPRFVIRDHRIRGGYKWLQDLLWTLAVAAGGFVAGSIASAPNLAWLTGAALAAGLVYVLWKNSWEAQQRGLPHQILISLLTCAGVAVGVFYRLR